MEQVKVSEIQEILSVVANYTEGCKHGDSAMIAPKETAPYPPLHKN